MTTEATLVERAEGAEATLVERADHSSLPAGTIADTDSPADTIDTLRRQIDALDTAIIRLVAERAQVSRLVQTVRINSGGTRVELGRERVILNAYKDGLGREGTHLADAVLQVCRGHR